MTLGSIVASAQSALSIAADAAALRSLRPQRTSLLKESGALALLAETLGIQMHASVDGRDKLWHADAGGWVAPVEPKHIADILDAKARTVPLARASCDELWLVIVHDIFSRAAPSELTAAAAGAVYRCPFDRLMWLDAHHPARSLELNIHPVAHGQKENARL